MRTIKILLLLVCCAFVAQPVAASTVIYHTDAEIIARSTRVVHGRVLAQRTTWDGPARRAIYTVTTLAVLEDFTGQAGETIEVWELGGVVGNEFFYVGGAVEYRIGEDVLVCLERGPHGFRSVAMNLSKFNVAASAGGDGLLTRALADTAVQGGVPVRERTLSEFRQLAAQVTGRQSLQHQARPGDELPTVQEPFTKLGGEPGFRWAEADSGIPVTYYRNTTAPSPLISSDAVSEIQTALATWTAPTTTSITLQYGGVATETDANGPFATILGPVGLITFEDPNNEISGMTLAIGGGSGIIGTGGTVNGNTFNAFTRAYVIFQNAADLTASFRQSTNFTRVLTHEIGHTIGLGHTQEDGTVPNATSNVMFATCCHPDTPVPGALGPDDLAGLQFIYPVAVVAPCTYTLSSTDVSVPAAGGARAVTVTTQAGCAWTAVSNSPFLTVTSGSSGTTSGTVSYNVAANVSTERTGSLTIAGYTVTVTQDGVGPTMSLDKTTLYYGAALNGTTVTAQTTAQIARLTQSGAGAVTWTVTSSQPWLVVSPASGTGSAALSITVSPSTLGLGSFSASLTFTLTGSGNTVGPIEVTIVTKQDGTSTTPFGTVDTPTDNATGITGAIPFTGWALDDIEVSRAVVCRAGFGSEVAPVDPNCGGNAQIFVGDGVFIDGARPDVQAGFPGLPRGSRAGWGFMVLTNFLPAQGNGTYVFYMYATDREGHVVLLGTRTITCDNAHATKPFGAIDTPTQGGLANGANFVNFGWALTQNPKSIPIDGSTIQVLIDGAAIGTVDYNHFRPDIAALFPGLANSNGAIGFRILDTTTLTNGLHTISWTVVDSANAIEGIGSRFFLVSNGVGAMTTAATEASSRSASRDDVSSVPLDRSPVIGRRGWDLNAGWRGFNVGSAGRAVMRGEEIDRFELWLGEQAGTTVRGYLRVGSGLTPLPVGSQLNPTTGWFTWAPGVGFVGTYDLVFVRSAGGIAFARQEVRVILAPKGSGHIGAQLEIDTPRAHADVGQPFLLGGWAADLDAAVGTGIDTLHVWAYPAAGGPPVFLGATAYGGPRADVAAVHGDQFRDAGWGVMVEGLAPGAYDLAVFPWSNVTGGFLQPKSVRVTVR